MSTRISVSVLGCLAPLGMFVAANAANADDIPLPAATPVFGISTAPDGSFLVSDVGSGLIEIRKGSGSPIAQLPGATDVAAIGRGDMVALTSVPFGGDGHLYRVSRGAVHDLADLWEFEATVNPDGGAIDSNPFNVAVDNGGLIIVADAAANALSAVDKHGHIDWIARLPNEVVPTDNAMALVGCPGSGDPLCGLPPALPAQAVSTSIAIGPDGYYYAGELKGFPAPLGRSKIWRINPNARHVTCGESPDCQEFATGFTSIVDLAFGPDGTLYVVELDEASWFAVETGQPTGGSVDACNISTGACTQIATGLFIVTGVTVGKDGRVSVLINGLIPGAAAIHTLD